MIIKFIVGIGHATPSNRCVLNDKFEGFQSLRFKNIFGIIGQLMTFAEEV